MSPKWSRNETHFIRSGIHQIQDYLIPSLRPVALHGPQEFPGLGETAGMDVALRSILNEMDGERPRVPKKRLAKVTGKYASMLDFSIVDGRMHLEVKQNAHTFTANRRTYSS